MFTGLSAFPLTPFDHGQLDERALGTLVSALAASGIDSLGVLGSTGSYAYLRREERQRAARTAVKASGGVPVIVGVGAISTRDVLDHVEDAQAAGAAGVLLAPMTYQPLTEEEVFGLYEDVTTRFEVPVVVYDNPATTGVVFSDGLHGRIAHLPHIASIKIPGVPAGLVQARERVARLRSLIPAEVTIGVSGDAAGARGLLAGCDAWYSVLAGLFPRTVLDITRAATAGDEERAAALSDGLEPVWAPFAKHGGYRVAATIARLRGLVTGQSVHLPVRLLDGEDLAAVEAALRTIGDRA
jgi:4-hydroxy-tetrahydrodipicolinate synthase